MKEFWNNLSEKKQKVIQVFALLLMMLIILVLISGGVSHDGFEGLNK